MDKLLDKRTKSLLQIENNSLQNRQTQYTPTIMCAFLTVSIIRVSFYSIYIWTIVYH